MPNAERLLIVDDDSSMRMALYESLSSCGYEVETAENGADALVKFKNGQFAGVVTDMRMPKMSGMDVLRGVKRISPATPVILITAYGTVNTAVEAMKEGASEFIMKPFSLDDLEFAVKNVLAANVQLKSDKDEAAAGNICPHKELITQDTKILALLDMLKSIAKSKSSVLIQGESGTGKELFARFVYRHSNRRQMPFVAVNCAAIPAQLLESEMFGYEKGAFTGADKGGKPGKFEIANKGTIFLDEIGDMPLHLQVKLLHAIQNRQIDRIGGISPIDVDVRIIAATNKDLDAMIKMKEFREDLYFRLNVIPLNIPPLRSRPGDTELLLNYALQKFTDLLNKSIEGFSGEAIELLMRYDWPGNVRELENVVEYAVNMETDSQISAGNLPDRVCRVDGGRFERSGGLKEKMDRYQKQLIGACLIDTGYSLEGKIRAAGILGISESTLYRRIRELGIVEK